MLRRHGHAKIPNNVQMMAFDIAALIRAPRYRPHMINMRRSSILMFEYSKWKASIINIYGSIISIIKIAIPISTVAPSNGRMYIVGVNELDLVPFLWGEYIWCALNYSYGIVNISLKKYSVASKLMMPSYIKYVISHHASHHQSMPTILMK